MDDQKLIIINPKNVEVSNDLVKKRGWQWSFMGVTPSKREQIIHHLGAESKYCYAKEFQSICIEQKDLFLDWISKIGKEQNNFLWSSTNIAYKNPLTSDLFLNYCYLVLIKRWVDQKVRKRVIIVENPWLINACLCNFNSESVSITKDIKYFATQWIKHKVMSYGRLFYFLLRSIRMWIVNKAYTLRYRDQISSLLRDKIDILTCTWIEDRSFKDKSNQFYDPYIGTLSDFYKKNNLKIITTTLPIFPVNLLKKTYESKEIIPSIHYTRFLDIARSFFDALFFKCNTKNLVNDGLDLTSIFEDECMGEKGLVCYSILQYFTFLNIFRSNSLSFRTLMYPFENQPWDKMMMLAQKHAKAKFKSVGCHNIGIPYFYMNFFLGNGEDELCPQPDIIASNGSYWEKVLKDAGFSCDIRNGGSLRFGTSAEKKSLVNTSSQSNRDDHVLVLLSTSLRYSLDLMFYLLRASAVDKIYYIKPHPDTPAEVIQKYTGELPANFKFVGGAMDEWMGKVGWAVHVGTNAAIECMLNGIKVFKYIPERIDVDPLLGLGFEQNTITDKDTLDFNNKKIGEVPSSHLIAEPFNEEMWNGILVQN